LSKQLVKATIYDKKGRILAIGYNSYTKTHPRQAHFARLAGKERKAYLHAEIAAIIRAGKRGESLFRISVERVLANGLRGCSKPCAICQIAIAEAGIKEVTYTV
jgi:deoxycytidylate deaminase